MVSITQYVYRNLALRAIAAVTVFFLAVTFASAQDRSQPRGSGQGTSTAVNKKSKRGPRAIAVVEFLPGGGVRLVPVALWIEGKYYDASLYGANPEPMAIEPRTVYEAQSLGEPTGTFTVTEPKQVNGNWVADGTWQAQLPMDTQLKAKAASEAAQKTKDSPSKVVLTGDADGGRPVLKRAPGSTGDSGSAGQTTQSTTTNDPDRPTMKRPASESSSKPTMGPTDNSSAGAPATSAKQPAQADDDDSNRPVMKRSAPPSSQSGSGDAGATVITAAAASSNDSDPNRPVLSHSKTARPAVQSATDLPSNTGAASSAAAKAARAYPAVSDAGQYQTRSLLYSMSAGERQVQESQLLKLAMDEIRAFAAKRNGPPIPKTAAITDYDARAYDLDYSNSPTVVLTGKLPVVGAKGQTLANFNYFVTIVARVDINDQAQKIFSSVTDSRHLDAFPRMELIDALDADANGRGDLLFRQYSDIGISYGLYRVSPYQIEKIFEGGSSL